MTHNEAAASISKKLTAAGFTTREIPDNRIRFDDANGYAGEVGLHGGGYVDFIYGPPGVWALCTEHNRSR